MKRRELEKLLEVLSESVPAGIRAAYCPENSCILGTRMAVEALRSRGVRARPVPVKLWVMNPEYWERFKAAEGRRPQTREEADVWEAAGAWSVTLGRGRPDDGSEGWDGHLVALAAERYLLDVTAGQLRRTKRDIDASAFWLEAPALAKGPVALTADDGCIWVYEPDPENRAYLRMPAWSAYRVVVRGDRIVSERYGPRPESPVAPRVVCRLAY